MQKLTRICLLFTLLLGSISYYAVAEPAKSKMKQSQMQMTKINLNTASVDQLITLPGVGKKKAEAIIEYRSKNGKFKTLDDLINVKGVGNKMLSKFKTQLTL